MDNYLLNHSEKQEIGYYNAYRILNLDELNCVSISAPPTADRRTNENVSVSSEML